METIVYCRSDSDYAERPLALKWQDERLEVIQILGRWRTPTGVHFKVKANNQAVFDLFYNPHEDTWQVDQI